MMGVCSKAGSGLGVNFYSGARTGSVALVEQSLVVVFRLIEILGCVSILKFPNPCGVEVGSLEIGPGDVGVRKSAPANSPLRNVALLRSASRSEANSIMMRAILAPLNDEPSSLALLKAPRMRPID